MLNPQAAICLPLLLRVGRELGRDRDVELRTLNVTGRALVRPVDAARRPRGEQGSR